ncbi:MAG: cytochrome d ubiquinol oxidase subunit II [Chloroflexota bacterium]|nr:cytochrome d ubiquinol oxidase subunit II [Lentimicrobium sp.]
MTEIIIIVLSISLLLYVLLGGADFGAGIIEVFTGKRGMDVISKAIAPIWEANHVWVILAVVILFNGFPTVYTSISTFLHIPILIVLLGIVLRGSAFTFRYYDVIKDKSQFYYTLFFRLSSVITPFFYGVILGAIMLGRIPGTIESGSFYDVFIAPWFNWFTLITGIFITLLFGWLAAVYTIGETKNDSEAIIFIRIARMFFISLIVSGFAVFVVAELYNVHFFNEFIKSPVSITCVVLATLIIPLLWRSMSRKMITLSRILVGFQTACIIAGWYAIQFPIMVYQSLAPDLTVYNSRAPQSTMEMLFWALIVGILIIFPSIGYLMKVFKFSSR